MKGFNLQQTQLRKQARKMLAQLLIEAAGDGSYSPIQQTSDELTQNLSVDSEEQMEEAIQAGMDDVIEALSRFTEVPQPAHRTMTNDPNAL